MSEETIRFILSFYALSLTIKKRRDIAYVPSWVLDICANHPIYVKVLSLTGVLLVGELHLFSWCLFRTRIYKNKKYLTINMQLSNHFPNNTKH